VRQHGLIAHELGHWALWDAGEDHTVERCARYLAGALMLPWVPFVRDVSACDWDLFDLQRRHANASAEMIVVRMTQISPSTAWVWDNGVVKRWYGANPDQDIDELVDQVLSGGEPVRHGDFRGWPLIEPSHRRVVVVRVAA
jgi:(2Fe-2S) ferredoxin